MTRLPDDNEHLFAEGQAGLLLAESLLLALIEAKLIDKEQAIETIDAVIASKRSMLIDGAHPRISAAAIGLLSSIANSVTAAGAGPGEPSGAPPPRGRRARPD